MGGGGEPVLVRHGAFSALRPLSALRRMDLNRVKFLLRAYLRTRLVKVGAARTSLSRSPVHAGPQIEEHVFHYLSGEHNLLQRLSPHELAFAQGCGHSLSQAGG